MIDRDLKPEDIQVLSGRDQITAFFARLGYNTDARVIQTPANLGISSENLTRQIRHIERVANQDDFLQVYLFDVSSPTVAITRALTRTFRNLAGHYLCVLTSDYERVDFVLVDRYLPAGGHGNVMRQRFFNVASFVHSFWFFHVHSRWSASPVNLVVSPLTEMMI